MKLINRLQHYTNDVVICRVKHQGQKPYQCEICKKQFVAKCNLDNHMWQHKNNRQRPFKCQLCNKAYLREALLEQHMRSHKYVPHKASRYPKIEYFHLSGALNLMSAMSVDFSSLLKVTGRDMWQSTVETGMGM